MKKDNNKTPWSNKKPCLIYTDPTTRKYISTSNTYDKREHAKTFFLRNLFFNKVIGNKHNNSLSRKNVKIWEGIDQPNFDKNPIATENKMNLTDIFKIISIERTTAFFITTCSRNKKII